MFYLLRVSEGRTLRQVFFAAIAAPLTLNIFLYANPGVLTTHYSEWIGVLGIIAIVLYIWRCSDMENLLLSATLYQPPGNAHALPNFLVLSWIYNIILTTFIYMTSGLFFLAGLLFASVCNWIIWMSAGLVRTNIPMLRKNKTVLSDN